MQPSSRSRRANATGLLSRSGGTESTWHASRQRNMPTTAISVDEAVMIRKEKLDRWQNEPRHMAGAWGQAAARAGKGSARPTTTSSILPRPMTRLPPEALVEQFDQKYPSTAAAVRRRRHRKAGLQSQGCSSYRPEGKLRLDPGDWQVALSAPNDDALSRLGLGQPLGVGANADAGAIPGSGAEMPPYSWAQRAERAGIAAADGIEVEDIPHRASSSLPPAQQAAMQQIEAQVEALSQRLNAVESGRDLAGDSVQAAHGAGSTGINTNDIGRGGSSADRTTDAGSAASGPSMDGDMRASLDAMDASIARLDHLFAAQDGVKRLMDRAGTLLQSRVRGLVVRNRFKHARAGLRRWRSQNDGGLGVVVVGHRLRQRKIEAHVSQMRVSREMSVRADTFYEWKEAVRILRPVVLEQTRRAEAQLARRTRRLRDTCFRRWFQEATGTHSRKAVTARYKVRLDEAVAKLEAEGKYTVVTHDAIVMEMNRDASKRIVQRKRECSMRRHFKLWAGEVMAEYRRKWALSGEHYRRSIVVRTLSAWVLLTMKRLDPSDGGRKQAQRRQRFLVAQNERITRAHFRRVHLAKHIRAWRRYCQTCFEVQRRVNAQTATLAMRTLTAFRKATRYQRDIKHHVLAQWKEYAMRLMIVPFRAWYIYASRRRARHRAQNILVRAFKNKKNRNFVFLVFKMWKHQAIYGKVESIYKRMEMIKRMEDQRHHLRILEANLTEAQALNDRLEADLQHERTKNKHKQEKLNIKEQEVTKLEYAIHQAEHNMVTAQSVIDGIKLIHPGTVKRICESEGVGRELTPVVQTVAARKRDQREKERQDKQLAQGLLGNVPSSGAKTAPDTAGCGPAAEAKDGLDEDFEKDSDTDAGAGACADAQQVQSEGDVALLQRVKWALSRLNFGEPPLPPVAGEETTAAADPNIAAQLPGLEPGSELHQLYGLFEFIRTGDVAPLIPENRTPVVANTVPVAPGSEPALRADAAAATGRLYPPSGFGVQQQHVVGQDKNWGDFVQDLAARFPPLREVDVRDRLAKRIAHIKDSTHFKLLNARNDVPNLYTSSPERQAQNLISTAKAPKQWETEDRQL